MIDPVRERPPASPASEPAAPHASGTVLAATFAAALAILSLVGLGGALEDRSLGFFTRDPAYATSLEGCDEASCAYAGVLSNVGVLVMSAAALVAAIAAYLTPPRTVRRRLLGASAALSVLVLADDLFLLHDAVLAYAHPQGQRAMLLVLGGCALAYVLAFRDQLPRTLPVLLIVCAVTFGTSLAVDQALDDPPRLVEDGAKFLGIVSWALWVVLVARPSLVAARRAAWA